MHIHPDRETKGIIIVCRSSQWYDITGRIIIDLNSRHKKKDNERISASVVDAGCRMDSGDGDELDGICNYQRQRQ